MIRSESQKIKKLLYSIKVVILHFKKNLHLQNISIRRNIYRNPFIKEYAIKNLANRALCVPIGVSGTTIVLKKYIPYLNKLIMIYIFMWYFFPLFSSPINLHIIILLYVIFHNLWGQTHLFEKIIIFLILALIEFF